MAVKAPPVTPKKAAGGGAGLIVALVLLALALGGGHLHLGAPGGGYGGHPPFVGRHLADDPCPEGSPADQLAHEPWTRTIRQQKVGGEGTKTKTYYLTCEHWRRIVDDLTFDMRLTPHEWPDAETVIKCIGNVIAAGAYTAAGPDSFQFVLSANQNPGAHAYVIANAEDDIRFASLHGDVTWEECAA